jgi:hypothetical protein
MGNGSLRGLVVVYHYYTFYSVLRFFGLCVKSTVAFN